MTQVYMNHYGIDLSMYMKENKRIAMNLPIETLPIILKQSIENEKKVEDKHK